MKWLNILVARLRGLLRRDDVIDDIEEEMRSHIEMETLTNIERGMQTDEARAKALRSFGNLSRMRELAYEIRGGGIMETLWQDLRYAGRMLLKNPGFTFVAVMTLALGIGANTAIFSVINAVLLKPLPYPDSDRLVMVQGNFVALNAKGMRLSVPEYVDFQERTSSFSVSGVFDNVSVNLAPQEDGEPERVEGGALTPEMFAVLKVTPMRGRAFAAEEAQQGSDDVVLLSYGLWQRRFAGSDNAIGQRVTINGRSHTIIGVMPRGFAFPRDAQIWQPLWFPKEQYDQQRRGARGLEVLARLGPEVSLSSAQADLDRLSGQLTEQYPQSYASERRYRMTVIPLLEDAVGELRTSLLLMLGAVGFVLLIACSNVANLLLARGSSRRQEIAVRLALGAGRVRLTRQLLTESMLLALAGGAAGLLLAALGVRLLLRFAPDNLPRLVEVGLDGRVLAFTALAAMLTGIVFGLVPGLAWSRTDVNEALREGGRSGVGVRQLRIRNAVVVVEMALALVLLTAAGLTLKSFWRLHAVDPGFNPDGVLTLRMLLPVTTHPERAQRAAFFAEVLERMRALPGVTGAGAVSLIPMAPGNNSGTITGENSSLDPNERVETEVRWASPGYFQTMGIAMLEGRDFTDADNGGSEQVTIVDETFARRFYPNGDAIGKRIKRGGPNSTRPWKTIVGVVRQVRNQRLDTTSLPQAYFPVFQEADSMFNLSFAIRTTGEPMALAPGVRAAVLSVDSNQPVFDVKALDRIVGDSIAMRRLALLLLSVFAIVALLLAASGIYGVMAYAVAQRTHEIGIRMALGAHTSDVLKQVLLKGMKLASAGVFLGCLAALSLTRLLIKLLYDVEPADPLTFVGVSALLVAIALLACWIPARRAAKVDPILALRHE